MKKIWPTCIRAFFAVWFKFLDACLFSRHHWIGEFRSSNGPVLLLANHTSWWDGVWIWQRNRNYWHGDFGVPMLEQSLQRWPFLKHLGGLPLSRTKNLANQANKVLQACALPQQLLLFFPEGQIRRAFPGQHQFQPALLRRLLKTPNIQVVFVYQVMVSTNRPRAEVFHFLQTVPVATVNSLQHSYASFAAHCEKHIAGYLAQQMQKV